MSINPFTPDQMEFLRKLFTANVKTDVTEDVLLLEDFTSTLKDRLIIAVAERHQPEAIIVNPITGQEAASVSHILGVLAFGSFQKWFQDVVLPLKGNGHPAVFEYRFPGDDRPYPSLCMDLCAVEELLPIIRPRAAPKKIAAFKARFGLS